MKLSSLILWITFSLLIIAMFASNILLKNEYDKIDKKDVYWNYGKILQQPFSHLKITGGNFTNISFEQNEHPSVSIFKNWEGYDKNLVKATVKNDTLFVDMSFHIDNLNERDYVKRITLVRITAPELLSIEAFNANLDMNKLQQRNLSVNLQGRSSLLVESYLTNFSTIHISQKDSSKITFRMSPDYAYMHGGDGSKNWEAMKIDSVDALVYGVSALDLGHADINSLKLYVSDTSSVTLSGKGLAAKRP